MGRFEISLPDNIKGEVRSGKVIKMQKGFLDLLLPWKKVNREEKTGYIIKVKSTVENNTEYRLFKTTEGNWSQDADGLIKMEGETAMAIKKAIEEHEKLNS
ncbi:MAG: hypothetical protein WKF97_21220 [Chitinophagaceae bacterium]